MRKTLWAAALAAGLMVGTSSRASAQIAKIYVGVQAPPAEVVEVVPPQPEPGPGWVWIKGHHRWDHGQYVWERGHWDRVPRGMHEWVPGHWDRDPNGYFWVEGRWR